eukprot:Skav220559  [mRNA]  locus=scaffold761:319730:323215:+ [translate_table: standard]
MAEGQSVDEFPLGQHAQICGLSSKPELNDKYCVSKGINPDNAERLLVVTSTGAQLSLKPTNLRVTELLPGSQVVVVGLTSAGGSKPHGDRWIVDMNDTEPKERKSQRAQTSPARTEAWEACGSSAMKRCQSVEEPPPEEKKVRNRKEKNMKVM